MEKDCIKKQGNSWKHQEGLKLIQKNELKGEAYNYLWLKKQLSGVMLYVSVRLIVSHLLQKKCAYYNDCRTILSLNKEKSLDIGKSCLNNTGVPDFIVYVCEVISKTLKSDLKKANFYSILNDGSTDSGVIE